MGGWSPWAQRAVWTVAALPFAFTITLGGPVVATLIALWLRRGGRRRGRAWRLWWFVGVSWLLFAPFLVMIPIDAGIELLRRTEFDASAWGAGDRASRTTMAHDLVDSGALVGLDVEAVQDLLGPDDTRFDELTGYHLTRGGIGYRDILQSELARPTLVLEWEDDRVRRASIGRYFKGRPFPAPRDDD